MAAYSSSKGAHLASATVPWHWLFFCPAPKFGAYFGCLVTKNLKALKWHWLILDPMGALGHKYDLGTYNFFLHDLAQIFPRDYALQFDKWQYCVHNSVFSLFISVKFMMLLF